MGVLPHDPKDNFLAPLDPYGAATHEVINQPVELADYSLSRVRPGADGSGAARGRGVGGRQTSSRLARVQAPPHISSRGVLANRYPPELDTHDRYGRRVDLVRFHPSYHALMTAAIEEGVHSSPWTEPREGAHVARAARYYMQTQVEAGHLCPITMTFAATPCLETQPDLAAQWLPKIHARVYDPRNVPAEQNAA